MKSDITEEDVESARDLLRLRWITPASKLKRDIARYRKLRPVKSIKRMKELLAWATNPETRGAFVARLIECKQYHVWDVFAALTDLARDYRDPEITADSLFHESLRPHV